MKKRIFQFLLILPFYLVVFSCKKKDPVLIIPNEFDTISATLTIPQVPYNYSSPLLPAFFNNQFIQFQNNTPSDNPVTDWGATLGRVLFYDKDLSINSTIACASCHHQEIGFTDTSILSKGFNGGFTTRHSMSLANAAYYSNGRFFWDERAQTLEEQVLKPIQDSIEMGLDLNTLLNRLVAKSYYPILFKYAFGDNSITTERVSKALAQFIRSMVSYRSKYDIGLSETNNRLVDFPNYSMEENHGKSIFMSHPVINCFGCHNTDVFIADNPRNNGIQFENTDPGIFIHTQNPNDLGKFKVPSLKNVALRKHFMHNGSLSSLDQVIEHYNSSILPNPNLDEDLKDIANHAPKQMNLTPTEMKDLKAFLETLTDHEFISDVKFSSPFK